MDSSSTHSLKLKEILVCLVVLCREGFSWCEDPWAPLVYSFASPCSSRINTRLVFHPGIKCQANIWLFTPLQNLGTSRQNPLGGESPYPELPSCLMRVIYCLIFTSKVQFEPWCEMVEADFIPGARFWVDKCWGTGGNRDVNVLRRGGNDSSWFISNIATPLGSFRPRSFRTSLRDTWKTATFWVENPS